MQVAPLKYPFTFEQWQNHPSSIAKIKWCKIVGSEIDKMREATRQLKKIGVQLKMEL